MRSENNISVICRLVVTVLWFGATANCQANTTKTSAKTFTDPSTSMEFIYIPAGCFQMGSPSSEENRSEDEGPVHKVCLDAFYMGKYEVTQSEYQQVTGSNPAKFQSGDNYPVEHISWDDAKSFLTKFNGLSGQHYRLPTEAEWEYAARAGSTTPFSFGSIISTTVANYNGNFIYGGGSKGENRHKTTNVGNFQPNPIGLYDMHGNVWEWCQDLYDSDYYRTSPEHNPSGPSSGPYRVLRGGGWFSNPWNLRSADRNRMVQGHRFGFIGFRLVLQVQ